MTQATCNCWIRPSRQTRAYLVVDDSGDFVRALDPRDVRELVYWDAMGPAEDEPSAESRRFHEKLGLDPAWHWEALAEVNAGGLREVS